MDARMVRVTLEMDLVEGNHFPAENSSEQNLVSSAKESFVAWLDSWCGEEDKSTLKEYIQTKVIFK